MTTGEDGRARFAEAEPRVSPLLNKLLAATKPIRLQQLWEWASCVQGWQRPAQQHHIAEFATHVLTRLRPACLEGTWQARTLDGGIQDMGSTMSPLLIDLPPGATDLASCVRAGHLQARVHALFCTPKVLCIQLARFAHRNRAIRKRCIPIQLGDLDMPCFVGSSNTLSTVRYTLAAAALLPQDGALQSTALSARRV